MALTNKLSAIGDSIRAKTGKTELLTLDEMPTEIDSISGSAEPVIEALDITTNGTYTASDGIDGYSPITVNVPQDNGLTADDLAFSGDLGYYFCSYKLGDILISKFKNLFSFNGISNCRYFCYGINKDTDLSNWTVNMASNLSFSMFFYGFGGKVLPNITCAGPISNGSLQYPLAGMKYVRNLPSSFDNLDFSLINNAKNWLDSVCKDNYSMRSYSPTLISKLYNNNTSGFAGYRSTFSANYSLDEVLSMPISCKYVAMNSNSFNGFVAGCNHLKDLTFELNNTVPYDVNWKSQVIDLTRSIGWDNDRRSIMYNSGITEDKEVTDDVSYQALKDDPDWFTTIVEYSRYNHDSAVRTINSLPDTSAYLSTAGGTNTIKFKGTAGSATDGGAINTLTPEEIAVATAKGWTVTLV